MRESVAVLGGFGLGVHFILFAAKAISMTSLDHWIKKNQNILNRKQCQELRGYLPTWSSTLIFLQAPIFICLDHSYRFLTGLFVSTLVNSNPFSKLHGSDRNTNYYVFSQLKGPYLSWPLWPLWPHNLHLPSSSLSFSHTGPLPAPFSVMIPLVPQPVPHLGCSNQSSPLSPTYNPLSPGLSCPPFHLSLLCSYGGVLQLSVMIAPSSFLFFVALATVCDDMFV